MNKESVIIQTTYSWLKKKIRFNAQDVVQPQQSNWIEEGSPLSTDKFLHAWIIVICLQQESQTQIPVNKIMLSYT